MPEADNNSSAGIQKYKLCKEHTSIQYEVPLYMYLKT